MEESTESSPPFSAVSAVATGWMLDYTFASLCHYFIEDDRAEEFQQACRVMEALLEPRPPLDSERMKAVSVAQFLTRIQQGKHPDVQFEENDKLTPLEAAAALLDQFDDESENLRNLHEEIKKLVKIQAVAVCMEKGKFKMASEVLDRQFDESETNKYVRMKLLMVIGKNDPYHEFLENFSYSIMMKKIKSYISLTLGGRPPCFLLQAATNVVEAKAVSKPEVNQEENQKCDIQASKSVQEDKSEGEENRSHPTGLNDDSELETLAHVKEELEVADKGTDRPQRRLFSLEQGTPWHPDKPTRSYRILNNSRLKMRSTNNRSLENQENILPKENTLPKQHKPSSSSGTGRKRQIWTYDEDKLLKKGVQKYGVGNWSKILNSYDFTNRTGTMLKDRWRTMKKLNIVHD